MSWATHGAVGLGEGGWGYLGIVHFGCGMVVAKRRAAISKNGKGWSEL